MLLGLDNPRGSAFESVVQKISLLQAKFLPAIREHWAIILITALAAVFRFSFFDLTLYWYDQAYPAYLALRILERGEFLIRGAHTSDLLFHPPLMAYLQALLLLFTRSPLVIQGVVTFLNLLAVPLTYFLALRLFDKQTAVAAGFLYAINPLAVFLSQSAWTPGLLPFFTALIAFLLFPSLVAEKTSGQRVFAALVAASLLSQTYLLGYITLLQVAFCLFLFRSNVDWRPVVGGILFFLAISLPFTTALIAEQGRVAGDLSTWISGPWAADGMALGEALRLVTAADSLSLEYTPSLWPGYAPDYAGRETLFLILGGGLAILLTLGIGEAIYRVWRKERSEGELLVLIWFLMPILVLTIHPAQVKVHSWFLLTVYPAGFILAARGARLLWRSKIFFIMALLLATVYGESIAFTYQAIAQHPRLGGIEWLRPRYSLPIGQVVRETTKEVYIHASPIWTSAVAGTMIEPYRDFDPRHFLVLRADRPALYIFLNPRRPRNLSPGFAFAQELSDKTIYLTNDGTVRFFLFPSRSREELVSIPSQPLDMATDIGWRFIGYDLPAQATLGEEVRLSTFWLIDDLPPNAADLFLKPVTALLDSNGEVLIQEEGQGQAGSLWRAGDVFIDTVSFRIPRDLAPGDYWLRIGLYNPNTGVLALFSNGEEYILAGPLHVR